MDDVSLSELSIAEKSLHAIRALGIFFIRSAVAGLVGGLILGTGALILVFGGPLAIMLGRVVIVVGAIVTIVWQIVVLIAANRELRASGAVAGDLSEWLGLDSDPHRNQ